MILRARQRTATLATSLGLIGLVDRGTAQKLHAWVNEWDLCCKCLKDWILAIGGEAKLGIEVARPPPCGVASECFCDRKLL